MDQTELVGNIVSNAYIDAIEELVEDEQLREKIYNLALANLVKSATDFFMKTL